MIFIRILLRTSSSTVLSIFPSNMHSNVSRSCDVVRTCSVTSNRRFDSLLHVTESSFFILHVTVACGSTKQDKRTESPFVTFLSSIVTGSNVDGASVTTTTSTKLPQNPSQNCTAVERMKQTCDVDVVADVFVVTEFSFAFDRHVFDDVAQNDGVLLANAVRMRKIVAIFERPSATELPFQ